MTNLVQNGFTSASRQWVNLFEITNLEKLALEYQLLRVTGLPQFEQRDKLLNQLAKSVAYQTSGPVALVVEDDANYLAVPTSGKLPPTEQQIGPYLVGTSKTGRNYTSKLSDFTADTEPIVVAFLEYALRTPLMRDDRLWGSGKAYYFREAVTAHDKNARIDMYLGFVWSIVIDSNGRIFVAIDSTNRYADRKWLSELVTAQNQGDYRFKHCLYHYGSQWFTVQFMGLTGLNVSEQRFIPEGETKAIDVYAFTRKRWANTPAASLIARLPADGPAIMYQYPGNKKQKHGALHLCKLLIPTDHPDAKRLHRGSVLEPSLRMQHARRIAGEHFRGAELGGSPIAISALPLEIKPSRFNVPAQQFGHNYILAVGPTSAKEATEVVTLDKMPSRRLQLVLHSAAGPLDNTSFDPQYILLPMSLGRDINEDFERRFIGAMRIVSGQPTYHSTRVLYDDRNAHNLFRQLEAIKKALSDNNITRGYVLLVLPSHAHSMLHNRIKAEFWPDLQFQCATANKIKSFYSYQTDANKWALDARATRIYSNYVQNCAHAMMVVNRHWPWALAKPLHYDVYIGIDVLNGMAGITFVYDRGRKIIFRNYKCSHQESLTSAQLRSVLTRDMKDHLQQSGIRPETIVVHRDGRTFAPEIAGIRAAVNELRSAGVLHPNAAFGIVDIRKSTASRLRLFEGSNLASLANPLIGSSYAITDKEGIVCTTGKPFRFPGTARPLSAVIREDKLRIEWVLEDIFDLSQLIFTAPDKCAKLPATIKLADDFLEPIASDAEQDEALYETGPIAEHDADPRYGVAN